MTDAQHETFDMDIIYIEDGLSYVQEQCYMNAVAAGWHNDPWTGLPRTKEQNEAMFPVRIAMIHSELSEALEGHRKGLMDDHLPNRPMPEVELADAIIRIMDLAGVMGYDIGGAVAEKLQYNTTRQDHKIENRMSSGGKKY